MSHTNDLQDVLRSLICNYSADIPVSAESVSADAMRTLDPNDISPVLVQWACVLELRQLARAILRNEYENDPGQPEQGQLFTRLQDRYPGFGDRDGTYLPRAMMTPEDYAGNIDRLRREAKAKQAHADKLEAECLERFGQITVAA
jgi:hypothetical protein